ncbi:hypothetical protein CHL67_08555 [Prosthecochloris sp. GSB1]|uniref:hypothetical protein n=1 Tax=Prosthecochloris sp. GSB1 TaxID=281093 RepID=UPI000B8CCEF4|nr:hypothetical protein [Prosthecochloris sp. GSB1]ASQ90960.1 hypothetical protein CHL67_08555 [Prosthecochloris sp. GSB1]
MMMNTIETQTIVHLQEHIEVRCSLFYGKPERIVEGECTRKAVFPDGEFVGYRIMSGNREHGFLFKTGQWNGRQRVPGVSPAVTLMVDAKSGYRSQKLLEMLHMIACYEIEITRVPDHFFLRFNTLLEGRNCSTQAMQNMIEKWCI